MGYGHCFFKQSLHEQVNEQALHLTFWLSGPHSENKQHKMNNVVRDSSPSPRSLKACTLSGPFKSSTFLMLKNAHTASFVADWNVSSERALAVQ